MIDGLGLHSIGGMDRLHQLVCSRPGMHDFAFPPQRDRAVVDRMRREQEADERELRAERRASGEPHIPATFRIASATADLFA